MEKSNVTPLVPKDKNTKEDQSLVSSLSPREIVSELDRFVVGQNKAKFGKYFQIVNVAGFVLLPVNELTNLCLDVVQILTDLSSEAVTNLLPSGLKSTLLIAAVWALKSVLRPSMLLTHNLTVLSLEQEAKRLPEGENLTPMTASAWPTNLEFHNKRIITCVFRGCFRQFTCMHGYFWGFLKTRRRQSCQ